MQDKQFEEFDRQLRSMLADAEAKPSRRVWKGVSARLDAASAPVASPWGWMRWAGMSLAAAAAIAAGVFFSGTRDTSIPTIIYNQEQATLAQAGTPAGAPTDVAAPAAAPAPEEAAAPAQASRPAVRRSAQPAPRPAAEVTPSEGQSAPETPAGAQAEEPQAAPASGTGSRNSGKGVSGSGSPEAVSDPFANLEQEEPHRKTGSRIALYTQGAVGSNDAGFRAPAPGARMAPGEQNGFTEQGSSTYGVPFTLGLGVRFYVAPRLSVGTGLDYSLLSRNFAGSYEGNSGTVSHTLQYLGIPVNVYYDILASDRIKFYAYGGGEAEYCISNKYKLLGTEMTRSYPVKGLQYSVGAGLGVEFLIGRRVGLYLDPGVNYYFPCNQPRNIRTEKPLLLNFDAGLRFNF